MRGWWVGTNVWNGGEGKRGEGVAGNEVYDEEEVEVLRCSKLDSVKLPAG